jgi:hypothetical protein
MLIYTEKLKTINIFINIYKGLGSFPQGIGKPNNFSQTFAEITPSLRSFTYPHNFTPILAEGCFMGFAPVWPCQTTPLRADGPKNPDCSAIAF